MTLLTFGDAAPLRLTFAVERGKKKAKEKRFKHQISADLVEEKFSSIFVFVLEKR